VYAIIETGGKQFKVQAGDVLFVEKLPGEVGEKFEFDRVLALKNNDQLQVGTPYVEGARVVAKILEHDKHKKILVFKYRAKKNYRRRYGHRQPFTRVQIEEIIG